MIGLDAQNNLTIAAYVPKPTHLERIRARPDRDLGNIRERHLKPQSMTFSGSSTTPNGGDVTMFGTRTYNYDDNLKFLMPPWFPSQGNPWTATLFRELPPSS